jgi:hypothetical protein
LIVAGRQQLTHEWWSRRRNSLEVVVSAIAATQGVSYLLTWNSAYIANAEKRPLVEAVCRVAGYEAPILCTPDELMGEDSHVDAS